SIGEAFKGSVGTALRASDYDFRLPAQFKDIEMEGSGVVCLSIPKREIPRLVREYLHAIETRPTNEICKCVWSVHPDDIGIGGTCCRECSHPKEMHVDRADMTHPIPCKTCGCETFKPRRIRMVTQVEFCPVHTPEGRVLGFFEFLFGEDAKAESDGN